jgi:hypothetical protein
MRIKTKIVKTMIEQILERGITPSVISQNTGVSTVTIYNILSEKSNNTNVENIINIAEEYGYVVVLSKNNHLSIKKYDPAFEEKNTIIIKGQNVELYKYLKILKELDPITLNNLKGVLDDRDILWMMRSIRTAIEDFIRKKFDINLDDLSKQKLK